MEEELNELIGRAETWLEEAQERLLRVAQEIERSVGVYRLSPEERAGIESGLKDMREGRIASEDEMEAFFAACR